jgi:hypothetical protein
MMRVKAGTSALARFASSVLVGLVGGMIVTRLLKALGLRRVELGALAGALMVVVHERFDRPVARQLTRVERRIRGRTV